ncbi:hypothetical protein ABK040_013883 [Willaertia magna]
MSNINNVVSNSQVDTSVSSNNKENNNINLFEIIPTPPSISEATSLLLFDPQPSLSPILHSSPISTNTTFEIENINDINSCLMKTILPFDEIKGENNDFLYDNLNCKDLLFNYLNLQNYISILQYKLLEINKKAFSNNTKLSIITPKNVTTPSTSPKPPSSVPSTTSTINTAVGPTSTKRKVQTGKSLSGDKEDSEEEEEGEEEEKNKKASSSSSLQPQPEGDSSKEEKTTPKEPKKKKKKEKPIYVDDEYEILSTVPLKKKERILGVSVFSQLFETEVDVGVKINKINEKDYKNIKFVLEEVFNPSIISFLIPYTFDEKTESIKENITFKKELDIVYKRKEFNKKQQQEQNLEDSDFLKYLSNTKMNLKIRYLKLKYKNVILSDLEELIDNSSIDIKLHWLNFISASILTKSSIPKSSREMILLLEKFKDLFLFYYTLKYTTTTDSYYKLINIYFSLRAFIIKLILHFLIQLDLPFGYNFFVQSTSFINQFKNLDPNFNTNIVQNYFKAYEEYVKNVEEVLNEELEKKEERTFFSLFEDDNFFNTNPTSSSSSSNNNNDTIKRININETRQYWMKALNSVTKSIQKRTHVGIAKEIMERADSFWGISDEYDVFVERFVLVLTEIARSIKLKLLSIDINEEIQHSVPSTNATSAIAIDESNFKKKRKACYVAGIYGKMGFKNVNDYLCHVFGKDRTTLAKRDYLVTLFETYPPLIIFVNQVNVLSKLVIVREVENYIAKNSNKYPKIINSAEAIREALIHLAKFDKFEHVKFKLLENGELK